MYLFNFKSRLSLCLNSLGYNFLIFVCSVGNILPDSFYVKKINNNNKNKIQLKMCILQPTKCFHCMKY